MEGRPRRPKEEEVPGDEPIYAVVPVNLLIAKQRNGSPGDVHVFLKGFNRYENAAKVSDADAPRE